MKIGNVTAVRGGIAKGNLYGGELSCGSTVNVPLIIIQGAEAGPVLWINSTVHGNELNGILLCKQLSEELDPKTLKGTVVITPLSNPMAFQTMHKFTWVDRLDMDQQFPGSPTGWFSERAAYTLFEEIKKHADYLISLHALAAEYDTVPYTIYKKIGNVPEEITNKTEELALAFGLKANCIVDLTQTGAELPGAIAKNMDVVALLNGIPAFMAEVGAGNCFEQDKIDLAKNGVYNVLSKLGMVNRPVKYLEKDRYMVLKRKFPTANRGGLFEPFAKAGEVLEKGAKFGHVFSPLEELETIETDAKWLPLGVTHYPPINTGDIIGVIALEWEPIQE